MQKKNHLVPRKLPCQERSRVTVAAIYEAASQVFTRNGYSSTTTDLIAERAGVSIGTLYQYFPSKDAILVGLWENHFLQARALVEGLIREMEGLRFVDREVVARVIRRALQANMEDRVQHRLFVGDIPWPQAVIEKELELGRFIRSRLEGVFRRAPNLRVRNPQVAAHVAYGAVYALIHEYILYWTTEVGMDEFIREVADMLVRYVFTGEERVVLAERFEAEGAHA